ncbi:MAG TPA: hypothetical protein DD670_14535, partial [Planctomycetaceae bacterium]|nr:hypothetical protein [Planctomycetaceae bacterium]
MLRDHGVGRGRNPGETTVEVRDEQLGTIRRRWIHDAVFLDFGQYDPFRPKKAGPCPDQNPENPAIRRIVRERMPLCVHFRGNQPKQEGWRPR